jgi:hypothetical protein
VHTENSGITTNSSEKLFQNEQNGTRVDIDTDFTQEERDNMTAYPIKPSEPSGPSASFESTAIVSVEWFFRDVADLPYEPLPEHSLEQSPCYPIIGRNNNKLYFCGLHPEVKNVYLDSIEQHCKYKDPDYHKSEILKLLSTKSPDNELAA